MATKPTFKIVVELDGMRLEVFLTESGDLAFHMTNTDKAVDAYIEADAFKTMIRSMTTAVVVTTIIKMIKTLLARDSGLFS